MQETNSSEGVMKKEFVFHAISNLKTVHLKFDASVVAKRMVQNQNINRPTHEINLKQQGNKMNQLKFTIII